MEEDSTGPRSLKSRYESVTHPLQLVEHQIYAASIMIFLFYFVPPLEELVELDIDWYNIILYLSTIVFFITYVMLVFFLQNKSDSDAYNLHFLQTCSLIGIAVYGTWFTGWFWVVPLSFLLTALIGLIDYRISLLCKCNLANCFCGYTYRLLSLTTLVVVVVALFHLYFQFIILLAQPAWYPFVYSSLIILSTLLLLDFQRLHAEAFEPKDNVLISTHLFLDITWIYLLMLPTLRQLYIEIANIKFEDFEYAMNQSNAETYV